MALFRPRRNPTINNVTVGRALPWGYGQWVYPPSPAPQQRKGEVTVDEADLISIPAFWAAIRMVANLVASMPPVRADTKEPYTTGFFKDPVRDYGWYHMVQGLVVNLAIHGNGYWPIIEMDLRGRIRRVQPVHPNAVFIRRNDGDYTLTYNISNVKYQQNEMIHFKAMMSGGYDLGLSPLKYLARGLSRTISEEELARNAFDDGGSPAAGYWSQDGLREPEALQNLAGAIQASAAGGRGAGTLVVDGGLEYKSPGLTMSELQVLQSRQWSASEAAMIIGVPAHLIGAPTLDSETYTSVQQTLQAVTALHLDFWRNCISEALNGFGMNVELSDQEILKPAAGDRYSAYKTAIESGVLTVNECRDMEGLEPFPEPEADEPRLPGTAAISMFADGTDNGVPYQGNGNGSRNGKEPVVAPA